MSKTLKELFDEHGRVWLAFKDTPDKKAIRPLDYSEISTAHIICESVCNTIPYSSYSFNGSKTGFVLYTPPKKKVRKYLWAIDQGGTILVSNVFHSSDIEPVKKDDNVWEYKYLIITDGGVWSESDQRYTSKKEACKAYLVRHPYAQIKGCQRITSTKRKRK